MTPSETFTDEALEKARVIFAHPIDFLMGCVQMEGLPPPTVPEVAFAGRSNVGKSSLINAVAGRKGLARASSEPGRTREVNLFVMAHGARLVDLPGYGFARAARGDTRKFQNLGRSYLRGRPNLKRVYLLIDAGHGLKPTDDEALDALDVAAVSYQIVLTKVDKIRPSEATFAVTAAQKAVAKRPAAFPRIALTSSETGAGIASLRAEIALAMGVLDDLALA